MSCYNTRGWTHKLIDSDNLANFCLGFNLILPVSLTGFVTPIMTLGFSINITWTSGGIYIRYVSGNEYFPGHVFEFGKYEVPKYLMNGD